MSGFIQGVGQALSGIVCNALNNPFVDGRNWGPNPPYVGEGVGSNPLVRDWYNNRIDGLKAVFCNKVEKTDNVPQAQFSGGQCVGVPYHVTVWAGYTHSSLGPRRFDWKFGFTATTSNQVFGPIRGARVHPSQFRVILTAHNNQGVQVDFTGQLWSSGYDPGFAIESVTVARRDGQPDVCGNPPNGYNPVNIYNVTANITYNNEQNVQVTKLGDFNLFAPVFLPGSVQLSAPISIPFTLQVDELKFTGEFFPDGTVNLLPDLEVNIGSPGDPQPPPDVPPPPRDPQYEVQPSPEQVNRLVGAWVVMTSPGSRASQVAEGGVTHYYPRYGIVKFVMQFGDQTVLSTGVDVKTARAYVPVPETGRAIGVRFFGYYGGTADLTPAYASINQDLLLEPSP